MLYLRFLRPGLLLLAGLLASCGSSNEESTAFYVRLVHTMDDAPAVQLNINDLPVHQDVGYQRATGFAVPVSTGQTLENASVEIFSFLPDGEMAVIASIDNFMFESGREYTISVTGSVSVGQSFVTDNLRRNKPVDSTYVEFINASVTQGMLSVYLTDLDVDLATVTPFASLSFSESSGSILITPGIKQIRIADQLSGDVLFDSGALDFFGSDEWQFSISDNLHPAPSPLSLVTVRTGVSAVVQDRTTVSDVRGVMTSTDYPAVDLYIGEQLAAPGLEYGTASLYLPITPGLLSFAVTDAGDAATILLETENQVGLGASYSYYIGSSGDALVSTLAEDDRRGIAMTAKVRFIHAVNSTAFYNVFLTEDLPSTVPPAPEFGKDWSLQYGSVGRVSSVVPGQYYLTVTTRPAPALENETLLLEPIVIQLSDHDVITYIIRQASTTDITPSIFRIDDGFQ